MSTHLIGVVLLCGFGLDLAVWLKGRAHRLSPIEEAGLFLLGFVLLLPGVLLVTS